MHKNLATVDYPTLLVGAGIGAVISLCAWLIAIAFKAGGANKELETYGKDIATLNKKIDSMQTSLNAAHSKAQNANATAEAAHALVKDTVNRLGGMQDDMEATFRDMLGKVDKVKDEILQIYKDKGK